MELRVGASDGLMELTQAARKAWSDFEGAVAVPFSYSAITFKAYAGPIEAVAAARLFVEGDPEFSVEEYAQVLMAKRFFELPQDRQRLTLLHESLHLTSYIGFLRPLLETKWDLVRDYPPPEDFTGNQVKVAGFLKNRHSLGFMLADHLFEMDAEFSLRELFPKCFQARARYYAAM